MRRIEATAESNFDLTSAYGASGLVRPAVAIASAFPRRAIPNRARSLSTCDRFASAMIDSNTFCACPMYPL